MKSEVQDRYFISSLKSNAEKILPAKRSYWGVENCLHWVLDIAFNEDRSRVRKDNAPQNFAVSETYGIEPAQARENG